MNKTLCIAAAFSALALAHESRAQNTRITDRNAIGWHAFTGTVQIADRWSIHTEYQWRREDYVRTWQQSLLRTGINYAVHPRVTLRLGYAFIETFDYGDYPLQGAQPAGASFPEHRLYQVATITDEVGRIGLSHRIMTEQRWVQRYAAGDAPQDPSQTVYSNRARYMLRAQIPLRGKTIADRTPYAAVYDEIFIGFGENVAENVFDQNRAGVLLGYRFNKSLRVEGGFFQQIAQLPREIPGNVGRNVFQYNNGYIVNVLYNLDVRRKAQPVAAPTEEQ